MKIKMLVSISGAGFSLSRGDETERFPENDALNLIKTGAAVLATGASYETATVNQTTETAVAALNVGAVGQVGQEPAGSGDADNGASENGTENAGAAGNDGVVGETGSATAATGTANAGTGDAGSGDQSGTAQPVAAKAKGKAD